VRVEVNIPADVLANIDSAAEELGVPRAVMIRTILTHWYVRETA
jgi:metal-responsive CopG/Arc/MetJ family transcriptional regulator